MYAINVSIQEKNYDINHTIQEGDVVRRSESTRQYAVYASSSFLLPTATRGPALGS